MSRTDFDDYEEPNPNCIFNYLLDTTAFNRFVEHEDWLCLAEDSLEKGFHYYKTANQDYELAGRGAKTYDRNGVSHIKISDNFKKKMQEFPKVMARLKVKRVPSVASLMKNHWLLDGSYRILNLSTKEGNMANEIFHFNEELRREKPFAQHYDAMSAEAAMHYGCYLVSDDKDLRNIVNKYFPKKAISTKDLIDLIQMLSFLR